jgi:hypothetical protein
MRGDQQMLDKVCAWCEDPAVGEVEVAPAVYEKQVLKLRAQVVPACSVHLQVPKDRPLGRFRARKDKTASQLDIFGGETGGSKSGNAIHGEAA